MLPETADVVEEHGFDRSAKAGLSFRSVLYISTVCVADIQRELMLSFGSKLSREEKSVTDSIRER
jgi:hypothetical protein